MIAKKIVYCKFGQLDLTVEPMKSCVESWHRCCPDYEFVELNESTFDVNQFYFTREAYKHQDFAFVADFARMWYLLNFGGIYLDTDEYLVKGFSEEQLSKKLFIGTCCKEDICLSNNVVSFGVLGSEPHHPYLKSCVDRFNAVKQYNSNSMILMNQCTAILKKMTSISALSCSKMTEPVDVADITIYPFEVFTCCTWQSDKMSTNSDTCGLHLYASTWRYRARNIRRLIKRLTYAKSMGNDR